MSSTSTCPSGRGETGVWGLEQQATLRPPLALFWEGKRRAPRRAGLVPKFGASGWELAGRVSERSSRIQPAG